MEPLPIASYLQRLNAYRTEWREFLVYKCSWMFALSLAVAETAAYLLAVDQLVGTMDWRIAGLLMAAFLMVPPVLFMRPRRPRPEDVLLDQQLRRSAGMDDTVRH